MTMFTVTVQKTVIDEATSEELVYVYSATAHTEEVAMQLVCVYASMVEYGMVAEKWEPSEMAFPREQLYQFITPIMLQQLEEIYPDTVATAYMNANAYVQSYIGNMFSVDAILAAGQNTSTDLTLRLALCISTATFILSTTPQYSDVVKQLNDQLLLLLKGLKSGQRNFGKHAIPAEPNVRVEVVSLSKNVSRP